jgi:hypothetical protein
VIATSVGKLDPAFYIDTFSTVAIDVSGTGLDVPRFASSDTYRSTNVNNAPFQEHRDFNLPVPNTINFEYDVTADVPSLVTYALNATGHLDITNQDRLTRGTGTAIFIGDFRDTLSWGGITSVTDAVTGQPIDDWKVTSASGFDYSQVVPEPPSLVLSTFALVGLARRRLRQSQSRQSARALLRERHHREVSAA